MICEICNKEYKTKKYKNKCNLCYNKSRPVEIKQACKDYHKNKYLENKNNPVYIKRWLINNWKTQGLKTNDIELIYDKFINTTHCELCNIELTRDKKTTNTTKCMDHNHQTGVFRHILCHKCNSHNPLDTKCHKNNKLKIKNITQDKHGYRFVKSVNKKLHSKRFKTLEEAIIYKEEFTMLKYN